MRIRLCRQRGQNTKCILEGRDKCNGFGVAVDVGIQVADGLADGLEPTWSAPRKLLDQVLPERCKKVLEHLAAQAVVGELTLALHSNELGLLKLFHVVREGCGTYVHTAAQQLTGSRAVSFRHQFQQLVATGVRERAGNCQDPLFGEGLPFVCHRPLPLPHFDSPTSNVFMVAYSAK